MRSLSIALALALALALGGCSKETKGQAASTSTRTTSSWVALRASGRPIAELMKEEVAKAEAAHEKPVVYVGASWCPPCAAIEKYRNDKRMVRAFQGTYVIELDMDEWDGAELKALGYETGSIPVFIAVDRDGKAKGPKIDGGAWGDNIPENMAPPLSTFVASI